MRGIVLETHVVAHVSRFEMATALGSLVGAQHVWVSEESTVKGEWRNHARALKMALSTECTHAVILQDDAVPVDRFKRLVYEAVEQRPDDVIGLYVGTYRPAALAVLEAVHTAEETGASWLRSRDLHWGVGTVFPTSLIKEMTSWCAEHSKLPYDQRVSEWLRLVERPVYYTWPSLVDHADTPTVIKGRVKNTPARVAHRVGAPVWNDRVVDIIEK